MTDGTIASASKKKKETRNQKARRCGIPKWLRRYQGRYGRGGVDALLTSHMQNDVPMLDNGRDRAAKP